MSSWPLGKVGVDGDGLGQILLSFVEFVLALIEDTEHIVKFGIVGRYGDSFFKKFLGLVVFAVVDFVVDDDVEILHGSVTASLVAEVGIVYNLAVGFFLCYAVGLGGCFLAATDTA